MFIHILLLSKQLGNIELLFADCTVAKIDVESLEALQSEIKRLKNSVAYY
jgi:hypothetical protein